MPSWRTCDISFIYQCGDRISRGNGSHLLTDTKKNLLPSLFSMVILSPRPPSPKKKKKVVREIREQKFSCIHTKALFTKHKRVFLHYLDYREWVPCACSHQSISHIVSAKALQKLKIQSLKAHRHITHRCEI